MIGSFRKKTPNLPGSYYNTYTLLDYLNLLLHLCFELAINHDFLLATHFRVEQFHSHVLRINLESPYELLLSPTDLKIKD